jgi:hypothetical protein
MYGAKIVDTAADASEAISKNTAARGIRHGRRNQGSRKASEANQ